MSQGELFLGLTISGLVTGAVYALVALGFVLIYKASSVINFAQGELMLVGTYMALTMVTELEVPFWPALALTLVLAVGTGVLVERFILRPFIGEPAISVIMATIGLSALIKGLLQVIWGVQLRTFPSEIFPQEPVQILGVPVSQVYLWSLGAAITLLVVFMLFFRYSRTGIAMRATADDETAALSMGISVKRILAVTWAIAAVVSAIGGVFLGNINGVNLAMGGIGLRVLPVCILGGLDSVPGAIIGGFVIGLLENFAGGYIDPLIGGGVKEVAPFVALVLILMVKPYGLYGKEIIERV